MFGLGVRIFRKLWTRGTILGGPIYHDSSRASTQTNQLYLNDPILAKHVKFSSNIEREPSAKVHGIRTRCPNEVQR